uniref:Uncharacterized protein n=1 Tax=Ciona savignyi TaxID=51511 RepID=H2ZKM2_CIOSA
MLFPRATSSPRYIDCWADSTFETDSKLPPKIPALAQHPTPVAVCRFGSRSLDKHHVSFNRRSDLQWRTCNTTFTQANFARQLLKQTRTNIPQHKTSLSFTPMKSASMSVLNFKEQSSNPCDCDITRESDTCETQVAQRSISAPNNRTNLGKSPDFHQKRTISSAPCGDKYSIIASQSVNNIHNTEISTSVNH